MTNDVRPRSRIRSWSAIIRESLRPLLARPRKTALTGLGVAVATAAFATLSGIQGMNQASLVAHMHAMTSNEVQVDLSSGLASSNLPWRDVDDELRAAGLTQTFTSWRPALNIAAVDALGQRTTTAWTATAVSPAVATRRDIRLATGSWDDLFKADDAAFVGVTLMREEGLALGDAISVDGRRHTIRGIVAASDSRPDLLVSVILPDNVAQRIAGRPEVVRTSGFARPGSASALADLAADLVSPEAPHLVQARAVPDAAPLFDSVSADIAAGARYVAAIAMLLGVLMVGLAQYSSVVEVLPSYSLKKSVGASGGQLLVEVAMQSGVTGLLGGVLGLSAGLASLSVLAYVRDMVAYVPWTVLLVSPLAAGAVGTLAGVAAAHRAARVDPIAFIRRT